LAKTSKLLKKQSTKRQNSRPIQPHAEAEIIPPVQPQPQAGVISHTRISWSAPILPPEIMKKYDEVVPDGAKRIFQAFEDETKHRRQMETKMLEYQGRDMVQGKRYALAFVFAALAVIAYAIYMGSPWVAAMLGFGLLGTIAFGFFRVMGDDVKHKPHEATPEKHKV
jgi:uncharacterized membrane protein